MLGSVETEQLSLCVVFAGLKYHLLGWSSLFACKAIKSELMVLAEFFFGMNWSNKVMHISKEE